jgi:pyruvyltransferase
MTKPVVYWGDYPLNFGDVLTANLLNSIGVKFTHTNNFDEANTFVIGSIARLATMGSTIFGSGVIRKNEIACPLAKWKFVRGPLTRENVLKHGGTCPDIYCDPALLLPSFCKESEKEYEIGIVPHYTHFHHMKKKYKDQRVIDVVNKDPLSVAKEITKCKKIVSSSLHGIICAHSYGIPAARINGPIKLHGDGIKFEDYYMSVKADSEISTLKDPKFTDALLPNFAQIKSLLEKMKYL